MTCPKTIKYEEKNKMINKETKSLSHGWESVHFAIQAWLLESQKAIKKLIILKSVQINENIEESQIALGMTLISTQFIDNFVIFSCPCFQELLIQYFPILIRVSLFPRGERKREDTNQTNHREVWNYTKLKI